MTSEIIFRDVTDIYSRLFNHKAALQGLCNNFVKEFEEKRGESEFVMLSRTWEVVKDCEHTSLPSIQKHLESNLSDLQTEIEKIKKACERISHDEEQKKSDWLESEREKRQAAYQDLMTNQVLICKERVDQEFETKLNFLKKHYDDLEEKLKEGTIGKVL